MDITARLTTELFDKMNEDWKFGCADVDDIYANIIELAYKFRETYDSSNPDTYELQLDDFIKNFLNQRNQTIKAISEAMPYKDAWMESKIGVSRRDGFDDFVIDHIYCDGTEEGSYIADENPDNQGNADIWFFDELDNYHLKSILEIVN